MCRWILLLGRVIWSIFGRSVFYFWEKQIRIFPPNKECVKFMLINLTMRLFCCCWNCIHQFQFLQAYRK